MKVNKREIIKVLAIVIISYAFGHYTVQSPKVTTKIDNQTTTDTKTDQDKHRETTTVTEKKPDGTTKTTTKTIEDTETKKQTDKNSVTRTDQTVMPLKTNTLNVSALAGLDLSRQTPVYGVSLSKQFIGPITLGAYGLTNGTVGISIGLNF